MKKILLTGYMGSGKTTIGKELAIRLNWPYVDLDALIEETLEMSIPAIFETKGEIFFRKQEHVLLKNCLAENNSAVISLGGGTPCYANNHVFFKNKEVESIYLKASIETLVERIKKSGTERPLLKDMEDMPAFIGQHLFERSYYYNHARYRITVDHKDIQQVVNEILDTLSLA